MRHQRFKTWTAVVVVLAAAGLMTADDRDFMSAAAAPPNLIFILDTSSSMVLSPEVTTAGDPPVPAALDGALIAAANVPGAGDDPYSRMGIAKRVLRDFLDDIGDANVVLAGYAQDPPTSWPIPYKHWVYEARAQDRFHMVEATYAYRFGYSENYAGNLLDNPSDILAEAMIGYTLHFNPAETEVTERFGPTNAYETGYFDTDAEGNTYPAPFDLMPIYFGNCFMDDGGTPEDDTDDAPRCWDSANEDLGMRGIMTFPFYNSGSRDIGDGHLLSERWYYGDPATKRFPDCDAKASLTPTADLPDDGCLAEWNENVGVNVNQRKRRVQLRIPDEVNGQPNHFLAIDASGNRVGNDEITDTPGNDNYTGGNNPDIDLDGDEASDWMLYVLALEETNTRECAPPEFVDPWTPTPTKTYEEYCGKLQWTSFQPEYHDAFGNDYSYTFWGNVNNQTGYTAEIIGTWFDWGQGHSATDYLQYLCFGSVGGGPVLAKCTSSRSSYIYWDDATGTSGAADGQYARPLDTSKVFPCTAGGCDAVASISNIYTSQWFGVLNSSATTHNGIYQVCLDFALLGAAPDGSDYYCTDICAVTTGGSFATPTPSPTITPTPNPLFTATFTPTFTPTGPTPTPTHTRTPTFYFAPTSTPIPTKTSTPRPPTPTRTPTRTPTLEQ